jgi:hypothetical protein
VIFQEVNWTTRGFWKFLLHKHDCHMRLTRDFERLNVDDHGNKR